MPRAKKPIEQTSPSQEILEPKLERIENNEVNEPVEEEARLTPPKIKEVVSTEDTDYLRKYQVRGQTQPGSLASDPPVGSKAAQMKKFLLSQPKIRMLIPVVSGQDKSVAQSVTRNGYRLDFPVNTYVEVPEAIADQLRESFGQTESALGRLRIDGNQQKETALI